MTGKVAGVDPRAFKIINGKLYLNWNTEFAEKFETQAQDNIRKADSNWKAVTQSP